MVDNYHNDNKLYLGHKVIDMRVQENNLSRATPKCKQSQTPEPKNDEINLDSTLLECFIIRRFESKRTIWRVQVIDSVLSETHISCSSRVCLSFRVKGNLINWHPGDVVIKRVVCTFFVRSLELQQTSDLVLQKAKNYAKVEMTHMHAS